MHIFFFLEGGGEGRGGGFLEFVSFFSLWIER